MMIGRVLGRSSSSSAVAFVSDANDHESVVVLHHEFLVPTVPVFAVGTLVGVVIGIDIRLEIGTLVRAAVGTLVSVVVGVDVGLEVGTLVGAAVGN